MVVEIFEPAVLVQLAEAGAGNGLAVGAVGVACAAAQDVFVAADMTDLFADEHAAQNGEVLEPLRRVAVAAERGERLVGLLRAAGLKEGKGVGVSERALVFRLVAVVPGARLLQTGPGDLGAVGGIGVAAEGAEHLDRLGIAAVFEKSACLVVCLLLAACGEKNAQSKDDHENKALFHAAPPFPYCRICRQKNTG